MVAVLPDSDTPDTETSLKSDDSGSSKNTALDEKRTTLQGQVVIRYYPRRCYGDA